ncbi:MAG: tyrosine-type recombinase/integrase [Clostridiales bacterium]|nr:tyrosine-type recombinase/integrase [Clostridiales bacterium]
MIPNPKISDKTICAVSATNWTFIHAALLTAFSALLEGAGLKKRGLHALRHTFATTLINGIRQEDGTLKSLSVKQVADILGHTTSEVTEMYYVMKDTSRLVGMTDGFEI